MILKSNHEILGVACNASKEEIKKAFRKLAHIFHPDKPSGNEAKFKEISAAYTDMMKRADEPSIHVEYHAKTNYSGTSYTWSSNPSGNAYWDAYQKTASENLKRKMADLEEQLRKMKEQAMSDMYKQYYWSDGSNA